MTEPRTAAGGWDVPGLDLARIFDVVPAPLAVLTTDLVYVAVNAAYVEVTGRSEAEIVGRHIFDVFPENPDTRDDESPTSLRRSLESVLETGRRDSMPLIRYDVIDDHDEFAPRYWSVTNVPVLDDDGQVALVLIHPEELTDFIDERLRFEAGGDAAPAPPPSQASAVDNVFTAEVTRLQSLSDLASALVGASSPEQVAGAVLRDGLVMVGASAGSLVIANTDRLEIAGAAGLADGVAEEWRSFAVEPGREPFSDAFVGGEALFFPGREAFLRRYPQLVEFVEASGHEAWAVLPLRDRQEIIGAIGIIFDEPQQFETPMRLVLSTLANLASQAASRARLLVEQTVALTSIEQAFEPRLDATEGLSMSHVYRASTVAADAGGDWYDLIDLGNGTALIAIGDVANHGAVAVGEMVRARATVHAIAHHGSGTDEIATEASAVLSKMASTFTTCVIALLDLDSRELRWTNAGHPHPMVVGADGVVDELEPTSGPPLGSGFDHAYGSERRRLQPGDTLVLYTDGLVERPGAGLDDGLDALRRSLAELDRTSSGLAERIFAELHPHSRQRDDVAILTIRLVEPRDGTSG